MADIDYVHASHQIMIESHGYRLFLINNDELILVNIDEIRDNRHPRIDREFTKDELEYIKYHVLCFENTHHLFISQEILYPFVNWYVQQRQSGLSIVDICKDRSKAKPYSIVYYYITAIDFQSHFREFNPLDSKEETYERDLAGKALSNNRMKGAWLLRHSSYNRGTAEESPETLQRLGIRYYALSFVHDDNNIHHHLIKFQTGIGWKVWDQVFRGFIECLEYTLGSLGLSFNGVIRNYYTK